MTEYISNYNRGEFQVFYRAHSCSKGGKVFWFGKPCRLCFSKTLQKLFGVFVSVLVRL